MEKENLVLLYLNAEQHEGKPLLTKPEDLETEFLDECYQFWSDEDFRLGNTNVSLEPETVVRLIMANVDVFGLIESGLAIDANSDYKSEKKNTKKNQPKK